MGPPDCGVAAPRECNAVASALAVTVLSEPWDESATLSIRCGVAPRWGGEACPERFSRRALAADELRFEHVVPRE